MSSEEQATGNGDVLPTQSSDEQAANEGVGVAMAARAKTRKTNKELHPYKRPSSA